MRKLIRVGLLVCSGLLFTGILGVAQRRGGFPRNRPLASLKSMMAPTPMGLERYVKDQTALIVLGKTLFWDMQAGSDGLTACATCHFHAGADHRLQNQLSGLDAVMNHVLTPADFPFHQFVSSTNNRSGVVQSLRQVVGSMGVVEKLFVGVQPGNSTDTGEGVNSSSQFHVAGVQVRQVTGRNTPSVINAVYNFRNFWDGRASNVFTGATPFGDSDHDMNGFVDVDGTLRPEPIRLSNSSLASQAAGPALNAVEMSWAGRRWADLGRKLLSLRPVGRQEVAADDSLLGEFANTAGTGFKAYWTYPALIRTAFHDDYWRATELSSDGYTQMELNFALFWSLSIQAYEATLVADDSRVDQFLEGRRNVLTRLEQQGLQEFEDRGSQCTNCHNGAELTAAAVSNVDNPTGSFTGFFRIGVTRIFEDMGAGGQDGFGQSLQPGAPAEAMGTFKAPGLRNVEFTGPYFHDGGQASLQQVVAFYGRNGDFPDDGNLGPGIGNIRLGQRDQAAIVAFLKALSDDRVRFQQAPFDHPSLCVPIGHVEEAPGRVALDPTQSSLIALDRWALVPKVGKSGTQVPLQTFEELLEGIGNDGSRANNMALPCTP